MLFVTGTFNLTPATLQDRHRWEIPPAYGCANTDLELYSEAVLSCDVPEHRLKRGDIVKLVDQHVARDGKKGYSIEVFNALGDTIAVTAVPESALEKLREDEVLCARSLAR